MAEHNDLAKKLRREGFTANVVAAEVGTRSVVATMFDLLKPLDMKGQSRTRARNRLSENEQFSKDLAVELLKDDYKRAGKIKVCSSCFEECVPEIMSQCKEGHIICEDCLWITRIFAKKDKETPRCSIPECRAFLAPSFKF